MSFPHLSCGPFKCLGYTGLWLHFCGETHDRRCMQPGYGEMRGILGHRGSRYTVGSDPSLLVCREEQRVHTSPLLSTPITHALHCTLLALVLLWGCLGSDAKLQINLKKNPTQTSGPGLASAMWLGGTCRPSALPGCRPHLGLRLILLPGDRMPLPSPELLRRRHGLFFWERSFCSPTCSHCLMGAP